MTPIEVIHAYMSVDALALVIFLLIVVCGALYIIFDTLRVWILERRQGREEALHNHDLPPHEIARQLSRLNEFERMRDMILLHHPYAQVDYRPTCCDLTVKFGDDGIIICAPIEVGYVHYQRANTKTVKDLLDQIILHKLQMRKTVVTPEYARMNDERYAARIAELENDT